MTFSHITRVGLTVPVVSQAQVNNYFKNARKPKAVCGPAASSAKKAKKQKDQTRNITQRRCRQLLWVPLAVVAE